LCIVVAREIRRGLFLASLAEGARPVAAVFPRTRRRRLPRAISDKYTKLPERPFLPRFPSSFSFFFFLVRAPAHWFAGAFPCPA
jgi:hypothetical protein